MDRSFKSATLAILGLLSSWAWACENDDFLPKNSLRIPHTEKSMGLTFEEYHEVIDKVERLYAPVVASYGAELRINRRWESDIVNAGTYRDLESNRWHINLYGGFARHPYITPDGYALVICHELGHHLGGAPKKKKETALWSSNEGQADYFATLKCLRHVFESEDNEAAILGKEIPPAVREKCRTSFSDKHYRSLCMRTSLAGLSVAKVNSTIQGRALPSFETPDPGVVTQTIETHPRAQCRLDTYFMGSVCEVNHYVPLSEKSEVDGTCHQRLGHQEGLRPYCWFLHK